jgi:hypothetical protein
MKNSIKTFICAIALTAATFTAYAENGETSKPTGFQTGVYKNSAGKVQVTVVKTSADAPTTLVLKDESGKVVYRETINRRQQKFSRLLNLEGMDSGIYQLDILSDGEVESKTIQLSDKKIERTLSIK